MVLHRNTKRGGLVLILSISFVMVLAASLALFLLVINKFTVEVRVAGDPSVTLEYGEGYEESGATAILRGDLVLKDGMELEVQTQGRVEPCRLGTYEIQYTASYGPWEGSSQRKVYVVDTTAPVITLFYNDGRSTIPGQEYREEGYLAMDACDGDLTARVEVIRGEETVTYCVADASGNRTEVIRQIRYGE